MVNEAVQLSPFTEDKCIQATPLMAHKYSQTTNSTYFSQLKTPEQLSSSTGCNSFELFHALCAGVETYISTYAPNLSVGKSLTLQDQVLLTLMKLKLNCSFTFLSTIFPAHADTCSRTFRRIIPILSCILRNFIITPEPDSIRDSLPSCFLQFAMVRYVLDCTEIPVCKPACIRCRCIVFIKAGTH